MIFNLVTFISDTELVKTLANTQKYLTPHSVSII